jgi:hypothetical protein
MHRREFLTGGGLVLSIDAGRRERDLLPAVNAENGCRSTGTDIR